MEHDALELMQCLEFAREHFEHTTDTKVKHRFNSVVIKGPSGREYIKEVAVFNRVTIISLFRELGLQFAVIGLDSDVSKQQAELRRVMGTYHAH